MSIAFDFGRNWAAFSSTKLDLKRIDTAATSLRQLIGARAFAERTFLDVGCGSGLFSIAAAQCGAAQVVGFDVNPTAVRVSRDNLMRFADHLSGSAIPQFRIGSALDRAFLAELGTFDIVYAWGVLHHTGAMWDAIRNVTSLVEPDSGRLVLAIYNQHWTSPIWKRIKYLYNRSPMSVRWGLNYVFGALIYAGVWVTTFEDPLHKERGMDFWYDVIDWLGGYPYEYANIADVVSFVQAYGFTVERITTPRGSTGCNEFVFKRSNGDA